MFLKKTAGFPVRKSLEVLGLPSRTYYRWGVTQGKGKRPEGGLPKGHWILPEEREANPGLQAATALSWGQAPVLHDAGPECGGHLSLQRLEGLEGRPVSPASGRFPTVREPIVRAFINPPGPMSSGLRTLPRSIFGEPTPSLPASWTDTPDSLCLGTSEAP